MSDLEVKKVLKQFLLSITGNDIMQTNNDNYNCIDRFIENDRYQDLLEQANDVRKSPDPALPIHIVRVSTWENASEGEQAPFIERAVELAQDTLFCTRVWSAWGYGTMTENDFVDATDEDDFINGIAKAIWEGY